MRGGPSSTKYAVVMCDLDGTLVDTMGGFADVAAEVMVSYHAGSYDLARRRYLETSGIPFCKQLEVIYPGHPANVAASDEFEVRKLVVAEATAMDADTVRGLHGVRALGVKLVVSSNTGQVVVEDFVAREGFPFDLALGFEPSAGLAKGEPHVVRVCDRLGVRREQILFVGDSLKDRELAVATSVAFVGRLGTFRAEDFCRLDPGARTIGNMVELPDFLAADRAA